MDNATVLPGPMQGWCRCIGCAKEREVPPGLPSAWHTYFYVHVYSHRISFCLALWKRMLWKRILTSLITGLAAPRRPLRLLQLSRRCNPSYLGGVRAVATTRLVEHAVTLLAGTQELLRKHIQSGVQGPPWRQ